MKVNFNEQRKEVFLMMSRKEFERVRNCVAHRILELQDISDRFGGNLPEESSVGPELEDLHEIAGAFGDSTRVWD